MKNKQTGTVYHASTTGAGRYVFNRLPAGTYDLLVPAVGFTLDELARILSERDQGGAPCREVRAMAAEKLSAIEGPPFAEDSD